MTNERITTEKNKYNKMYTDLVFACDDLKQMLDENELNKRSFIRKVDTLKDYMEFLDSLDREESTKKGLFSKLLKKPEDTSFKINSYLTTQKRNNLEKLEKCNSCKCKNCVSPCPMNHCYNCREKEYVAECDKNKWLLTRSTDTVTLYQGDEEFVFNVAGYLVEKDSNGDFYRYVYLIDTKDYDNQHILKYYKFKGEEHFDSVIEDDSKDNLVRLENKFVEMGLSV
ncbi:MAG: hypothetical protein ACRC92_09815 [Peptostreptococcaceae bacterium]